MSELSRTFWTLILSVTTPQMRRRGVTRARTNFDMLYDSTKVLLRDILVSLETADKIRWEEHAALAGECSYELHQMARPRYQGYRKDPTSKTPATAPVSERASRAIPHVKLMARAIRRKDQAAAIESGKAALAEM